LKKRKAKADVEDGFQHLRNIYLLYGRTYTTISTQHLLADLFPLVSFHLNHYPLWRIIKYVSTFANCEILNQYHTSFHLPKLFQRIIHRDKNEMRMCEYSYVMFYFHSYNWYSNQFNPSSSSSTNTQTNSINGLWNTNSRHLHRINLFKLPRLPISDGSAPFKLFHASTKDERQKIQNIAVSQSRSI